jgi:hypothetical protein
MKNDRLVELAIEGLKATRERIDEELSGLLGLVGIRVETKTSKTSKKSKKGMSASKRKAHSARMKKIWAERRKGKK